MLPPRIPNRYDDDDQRLRRLEAQDDQERRKWLVVFSVGLLLLLAMLPCLLVGWGGIGLILVPTGVGMMLGAGMQLVLARFAG